MLTKSESSRRSYRVVKRSDDGDENSEVEDAERGGRRLKARAWVIES
jgi:hypothetical protein